MRARLFATSLLVMGLSAQVMADPASLARTDQLTAQKVASVKATGELKLQWQEEAESLKRLKTSYLAEKQLLQDKLRSAGAQSDDAALRRQTLAKEQASAEQTAVEYQTLLARGVESFGHSWGMLPEPLKRDQLQEYRQLTNDKAELTQRLTALVNLLEASNSFNQTFTLDKQLLNLNGQDWQVDVLYIGLARALFRLPDGSTGGMGSPSADGWQWQVSDAALDDINQAFAIYLQKEKASLVDLPLLVKEAQ